MQPSRRTVLAALLAAMLALTAFVLADVLATVVFAITVAYVLYPLQQALRGRGFSTRAAAVVATATAFLALVAIAIPFVYLLYSRRAEFVEFLRSIPSEIPVEVGGFSYVVETAPLLDAAVAAIRSLATAVATTAPVFALKALLLVMVVYGLLYAPTAPRVALLRLCPGEYHDVMFALHRRTANTLRAIYVLQAATAFGTFVVAFGLFALLGYSSPLALAAMDVVAGNAVRALLVTGLGLFFVGFVPDAVIRPRLAGETTDLPVSVYFVGFVGGLLSLGAIGFVVGPLVVALFAEVVNLLSDGPVSEQTKLSDRPAEGEREQPVDGPSGPSGGSVTDSLGAAETADAGDGVTPADPTDG